MKRRCLSALLTLALIAGLLSAACITAGAENYSDAEVTARLAAAESVWPDGGVYADGWDDGCETCYGFIRELFRYVFSAALPTMWSTADARFTNNDGVVVEVAHADWYSLEQLRGILASARPGDVLIATTGYGSHTVIVRSAAADGSGVYAYDANWNKNSAGQPLIRTNAWWSAEDMRAARPGAVTLYRLAGQGAANTPSAGTVLPGGSPAGTVLAGGGSAPAAIRAEKRVYGSDETLVFYWDTAPGATGYYVSLSRNGAELYGFDVGGSCSFTATPLRTEGDYVLTVHSVIGGIRDAAGAELSFTVTDAPPEAVKALATDKDSYTAQETISASWDEAHGAESYYLYLLRDDGKAFYAETRGTAITLSALPEAAYTLTVWAVNHAGYTDGASAQITVGAARPGVSAQPAAAAQQSAAAEGVHFARTRRYVPGQFPDVNETDWYAESVAAAYELGLMEGGDGTFGPGERVTILQAIIMADRLHSIYTTGGDRIAPAAEGVWYQPYLDYAVKNGLIIAGANLGTVQRDATRMEFAQILAAALPAGALPAINAVADGAVQDVAADSAGGASVYLLYRAGVLTGGGDGAFRPGQPVTRAEAAAILARMAESDLRVEF